MPEIIETVFAKTSPKRSFSMTEYERFGLVFTKTRVYKFGHWGIAMGPGGKYYSFIIPFFYCFIFFIAQTSQKKEKV